MSKRKIVMGKLLQEKKQAEWKPQLWLLAQTTTCVDYKTLDKVMVLDKFPILVVDELLNDLYGTVISSKIDLKFRYHHSVRRGRYL